MKDLLLPCSQYYPGCLGSRVAGVTPQFVVPLHKILRSRVVIANSWSSGFKYNWISGLVYCMSS